MSINGGGMARSNTTDDVHRARLRGAYFDWLCIGVEDVPGCEPRPNTPPEERAVQWAEYAWYLRHEAWYLPPRARPKGSQPGFTLDEDTKRFVLPPYYWQDRYLKAAVLKGKIGAFFEDADRLTKIIERRVTNAGEKQIALNCLMGLVSDNYRLSNLLISDFSPIISSDEPVKRTNELMLHRVAMVRRLLMSGYKRRGVKFGAYDAVAAGCGCTSETVHNDWNNECKYRERIQLTPDENGDLPYTLELTPTVLELIDDVISACDIRKVLSPNGTPRYSSFLSGF